MPCFKLRFSWNYVHCPINITVFNLTVEFQIVMVIEHEKMNWLHLGFPAKRVNQFAKISHFSQKQIFAENFALFRISFAHKKCENFRFFRKISLKCVSRNMRNFNIINKVLSIERLIKQPCLKLNVMLF